MPTLFSPTDREAILRRLRRLTSSTVPNWGKFTAPRMLCHIADQLRLALGDLPAERKDSLLSRTLLRWLVVHTPFQAPPGKVETLRELLTSTPTIWGDDMRACETLVTRLPAAATLSPHPVFGRLSRREWGLLTWKHLDHHLRQFGL